MRVIVAGGGIGGLAIALALEHAGIRDVLVLDAATRIRPIGLGLSLLPHAVRELTEMDVYGALANTSVPVTSLVHHDRTAGKPRLDRRGTGAGYDWPQLSVHRGDLQVRLLTAVHRRLGRDAVISGIRVTGFDQDEHGVVVYCRDEQGNAYAEKADVLIGADGIHSAVRARLHPGEPEPVVQDTILVRGLTRMPPFLDGHTMIAAADDAQRCVAHPIKLLDGPDGAAVINWVAELPRAARTMAPDQASWNRPADLPRLRAEFAAWNIAGVPFADLAVDPIAAYEYPHVSRPPLPRWSYGRVTLLGDAAHPMHPFVLGGASESVVDARVLARQLASHDDPVKALEMYELERLPVTRWLQSLGWMRAAAGAGGRRAAIGDLLQCYRVVPGLDPRSLNARVSNTVVPA